MIKLNGHVSAAAAAATSLFAGARVMRLFTTSRRNSLRERLAVTTDADSADAVPMLAPVRPRRDQQLNEATRGSFRRLETALDATGGFIRLSHVAAAAIISAAIAINIAINLARSPLWAAIGLGASAAIGCPALLVRFAQRRYQQRFLAAFPDALDLIVRAVRSGLPLPHAIDLLIEESSPPVAVEFRLIRDKVRLGLEMKDALQETANRVRVPDFRFFAVCLTLQQQTGGGLADTLSNLSALIRNRQAVHVKARALTAEIKTSAIIISFMPLVAAGGFFFINPRMMESALSDPRGRTMLSIGAASLLLGIAAMIIMIQRVRRR